MAIKYNQEEPSPHTSEEYIYGSNWKYNTFTPALDYEIEYIIVDGFRSGNCGDVTMHIYEADGAHKPDISGGSLGNIVKAQGDIVDGVPGPVTFTFASPIPVSNGQEYAIVISAVAFGFVWDYGVIVFQDGYEGSSNNAGSTWFSVGNFNVMWFQVWGTAAGNSPVDTPSPTDEATGQQSGSVDLSWDDPNDPEFDDYDIYLGPTGSMVLVETGHATKSLTISDDMILGQEYSWRVDGNDGEDVIQGSVWTFTIESFAPPSTHLTNKKRLVVASFDQVWYEDIS